MLPLNDRGILKKINAKYVDMLSIFVILTCCLFLFLQMTVTYAMPLAFFLTCLLFLTDGNPLFFLSLTTLVATVLFTIFDQTTYVENSSILVYYFLLGGIVLELTNPFLAKLKQKLRDYLYA